MNSKIIEKFKNLIIKNKKEVLDNNDLKKIEDYKFMKKGLTFVNIDQNITVIGKSSFSWNRIKWLIIPKNIKVIEEKAFEHNKLKKLIIPENVILSKNTFSNNELVDLTLPKSMKVIPEECFRNNMFKSLKIPESVLEIGDSAFSYNRELEKLKICDGVRKILFYAFGDCKIKKVILPDSVEMLGDYCFYCNNIEELKLSKNIKVIPYAAFEGNKITSIDFSDNLTSIEGHAFYNNELKSVTIPSNVKKIGAAAFFQNNISDLEIKEGVEEIAQEAFLHNDIKTVYIPKSVTSIGTRAFDVNTKIYYDNVLIDNTLIANYGTSNLIKIYELSKKIPQNQINISKEIMDVLPQDSDSIKGFILNKKKFDLLVPKDKYFSDDYQDIFKLCYVLGLFNNPTEEIIEFIKKILSENKPDFIHQMFTSVRLNGYKPKFKDIFINLYNEKNITYNGQNIIGRLYSSFEKIHKYTLKRHEDIISKNNTKIKRLKENGVNTRNLEEEIRVLEQNKKIMTYDDIAYYINNNAFDIREGNEDLDSVVDTLSVHMEQAKFDKIQTMFEEARDIEKNIPLTKDTSDKDFKYHWSKSDNPVNTILGYLVSCCAKLDGAGEDIMRQSMINPDIANLIIYDENNQVIGKATAYYNRDKKYILFNNAETKEIIAKGLKSAKKRQKECLEALIRGTNDAIKALKMQGKDINEVRIGMKRNDLAEVIKDYGLEISHDLLESYKYQGYDADASDINSGQAILYKDEENNNLNLK